MAHNSSGHRGPSNSRKRPKKGQHRFFKESFSYEESKARMQDVFFNHGFKNIDPKLMDLFCRFYLLLREEQNHQNITRLLNLKDVTVKHFVDCLIIVDFVKFKFPLLDIGTGAGFPGIPLKFLFPEQRILLAEGVQSRVEFLKKCREKLELKNLDILGRKIDESFELPVQGVITRAVMDISLTVRLCHKALQPGGHFYFMKGPQVDNELQAVKEEFGDQYKLITNKSYSLPQTPHQRRFIVLQKLESSEL